MKLRDVRYTTTEICRNLHSLVKLGIDIWDGFQLSEHCSQLQNLKSLTLNVRQRIKFLNQSFEVLDGLPIETLRLQGTLKDGLYSKPIEVDVLRPLHQLKTLEIEFLVYISYLLQTIIYPFRNKTMDLIFKNFIETPFQSVSSSDLKYIKDICVRKLIMTTVSIQSFDAGELLNSRLWHCLEEFDISRNSLRTTLHFTLLDIAYHVFVYLTIAVSSYDKHIPMSIEVDGQLCQNMLRKCRLNIILMTH